MSHNLGDFHSAAPRSLQRWGFWEVVCFAGRDREGDAHWITMRLLITTRAIRVVGQVEVADTQGGDAHTSVPKQTEARESRESSEGRDAASRSGHVTFSYIKDYYINTSEKQNQ